MPSNILKSWDNVLKTFADKDKDIYFTEGYVKLYQTDTKEAECFSYTEGEKVLLFPYLKSKIPNINAEYYDFETPYGYGGPISNTTDQSFIEKGIKNLFDHAGANKIVCGFIRFHSLLENQKLFTGKYSEYVRFDRKTIAIDLTLSVDDIWLQEIHSKHRNVIRKAEDSNLRFSIDKELDTLEQFIGIYYATMDNKNAGKDYFFDKDYFYKLRDSLKPYAFIGNVYKDEKLISSAIFFNYGLYGHYHLSGSVKEFLDVYPNNYLIFKTALYLKECGAKLMHLGGGTNGEEENSLYKFKKRFSKDSHDFYIGKVIFNPEVYREICGNWETLYPEKKQFANILQKYRY